MPVLINNLELLRYFRQPETAGGKSIQREWNFAGMFIYNPFQGMTVGRSVEFPPIIQPFHILSVTIPTYSFEKQIMMYGQVPRSFPVLNFKGFNISITLEEDEKGTVEYFVNWNQRNIIDNEGYYNPPNKVKLKAFIVEVYDKMGIPIVYYNFHDIYFLEAEDVTYSYEGNGSIKRALTFGCDRMSTIFTKQNIVAQGIGMTQGLVSGIKNELTGRFRR